MTGRRGRRFAWLLNRRLGIAFLWMALVMGIAVAANLVGIRMLGGIEAWSQWLTAHAGYFFAWRLVLYGATAWGWRRLRICHHQNGKNSDELARIRRVEVATMLAVLLLEASNL
ncbi:hypothetical protein [Acidovorax sp. SUPP3334]|uniref:hypothetical protein n=1 Tax=Acidovorax sp. SUPP3334 TaxID=2920881 RepID=UPI0023DE69E8|nr:hypothetical protein [Acidovorax sp. SUPP3334]GKT24398.1 hypothetical protein AVHM3334_14670 [Acidovorax sp. SUPP3334]